MITYIIFKHSIFTAYFWNNLNLEVRIILLIYCLVFFLVANVSFHEISFLTKSFLDFPLKVMLASIKLSFLPSFSIIWESFCQIGVISC